METTSWQQTYSPFTQLNTKIESIMNDDNYSEVKMSQSQASSTWSIENVASIHLQMPNISIQNVVNATWAIVVWQYTGLEDIRFLTATTEQKNGKGSYSIYETHINGTTTLFDLVQHVKHNTRNIRFEEIQSSLGTDHTNSNSPLMKIMTTFPAKNPNGQFEDNADMSLARLEFPGIAGELVITTPSSSADNTLKVHLHFTNPPTSQLDQEQAHRVTAVFVHVMNLAINGHVQDKLETLDLVSDQDKATLWTWNSAQLPETVHACVHSLFRQQAHEQPDAPAVDAWDGKFTYGELDAISDRIAARLSREEGVQPESIVPLCFDKSCWAIAALMGVIKAGGAIVFIDPAHPLSRRRDVMEEIGARFVMTSRDQAAMWEGEIGARTMVVDKEFVESLPQEEGMMESEVTPENLVYLIFTSGSTGKPKGCLIQHRAFISGALQHAAKSNLTRGSRVMQLASYSFDVSMLEILTSLISGACVCTPNMASLAQGLSPIVNGLGITWAFLTPSLVKLLRPEDVPGLKTLALGGEPLHKADIETWAPHLQLINGYGPSECSVAAAGDANLTPTSDPSNIGRAVGGLCWVVDAENHDRLVPIGAVGELLISGPILARGYLNDAEKTAAAFIEAPKWTEGWSLTPNKTTPGQNRDGNAPMRFYRTGDLAKFNNDGTIQLLGRKDTQVKLRGLRVELGDIEHNMAAHAHVKHVAAFLPKSGPCGDKIVAVLCLHDFTTSSISSGIDVILESQSPGVKAQVDAVQTHLRTCVPEYMVPALCIVIEAWPLLVSAKLDRKRVANWLVGMEDGLYNTLMSFLPGETDQENPTNGEGVSQENLSEVERTLRDMFAHALKTPVHRVPLDKSFIGLGGDSLAAMRMVGDCRSAGLTGIKMEDILKSPGITHLATCVDRHSSTIAELDTPFPLSRAQREFLSNLSGDKTENEAMLLRLDMAVSPLQLEASLGAVVARHSMLRVHFTDSYDSQTITSQVEGSFRFKEHSIEQAEELADIIEMAQRSVALVGPVFSADLVRVDGRQLLFIVGHGAVIDSVSWGIVVDDLETYIAVDQDRKDTSTPFQSWVKLESSTLEVLEVEGEGEACPPPDLRFWGMEGRPNLASERVKQTVELDEVTTSLLLDAKVHKALRTDAQDFLLASLLCSFGQIFSDSGEPTISVWEDGRSCPDSAAMDFSATVGRFERSRRLVVDVSDSNAKSNVVSILKRTKDARRLRLGQPSNAEITEISFRYRDLSHILDRPKALIQREPFPPFFQSPPYSNTSSNTDRQPHLIFIVAEVINHDKMQLVFSYNRHISHRVRIWSWIAAAQKTLASLITKMLVAPVDYSLSDFPLLLPALTYDGLDKLLHERLPRSGLGHAVSSIEDMYPCSPMQQDLLISQSRASNEGMYEHYHISEVRPRDLTITKSVDASQLAKAWEQVVQRHSSLRTVFVESSLSSEDNGHGQALFDQVVLTKVQPTMSIIDCHSDADVNAAFAKQSPVSFRGPQPPHRLTICRIGGKESRLVVKLDINHAIVDGGSIAVILRDLLLAYDGHAILSEPAFPFRNYMAHIWQTPIAPSLEFWAKYLDGQTPTMLPRLATLEVPAGGLEKRRLNELLVPFDNVSGEGLSGFCQRASVTRATVFQAAWALVLRKYTESPESVCFGYLSAGRDAALPGIEDGVGAFLTMLICRVRFDNKKNNKLDHTIRTIADDYTNCLPHQHVGLSSMQHALKTGGNALFNTIIAFNREPEGLTGSTITMNSLQVYDPDEYAVTVDVRFADQHGVNVSLRHWTDSLTPDQGRSIASAFGKAIEVIVHSPPNINTLVTDISLVSNYHREKLLSFNSHDLPKSDRLMFTRFEEHAQTQSDAQAICAWDGTWTYRQLDEMSTKLAHFLRTLGVGPEVIVPHCFQKSGYAVITCMAILKAGGAFVGLDPSHPKQRLWKLIDDIKAKVICVSPQNDQLFTNTQRKQHDDGITIVTVTHEFIAQISSPPKSGRPCSTVRPDNAACVVFTSGTTGRPKAIVIEHASMSSTSDLMGPILGVGPQSRVFQFASYTFDVSNQDVFTTLQRGGCVCIPSEEDRINDPAGAIERLQANFANLTSTMMGLIGRPDKVPSLKRLVNLGEPLARENLDIWAPAVELYNTYGPAEASVSITCNPERMGVHYSSSNIGKSYGCWSWVVDAADYHELVPIGVVGELLIEGPLLARHYHDNPPKTAEAFVENPRWAQRMTPGMERRFYRTGDLCRFNSDGSLSMVGRRDTQVKINGQRVELDDIAYEIQGQLGGRSLVSVDALPILHPQQQKNSNTKQKILVAFIQFLDRSIDSINNNTQIPIPLTDSLHKELTDLHRALKARLPGHMIPTMFIPITTTPRTANGKLARDILRETVTNLSETDISRYMLKGDHTNGTNTKIPPSTPQEKTLQALWSKVLGIPAINISADDLFSHLGGDSVMAMRLVGAARAEHVSLTVADIFRFPVLSDMAGAIRTEAEDDEAAAYYEELPPPEHLGTDQDLVQQDNKEFDLVVVDTSVPPSPENISSTRQEAAAQCGVPPEQVVDLYPCTPLQQGLMALSTRHKGAYKAQRTFRLTNPHFDMRRFRRAVDAVIRAEAILRTRIVNTAAAGLLQAVLDKNGPSPVTWIKREGNLASYLKEDMEAPVRYGSPLLRLALVTTTNFEEQQQQRYIVWSAHHVLYDGFSMDVTFEQIAYALEQVHQSGTSTSKNSLMIKIKPTPAPFKNFIRYLQDQARDMEHGGPTRKYWTSQFPPTGETPASYPATSKQQTTNTQIRHHLTRWAKLKVPRSTKTTPKISLSNYLRAAWALVVSRHLDNSDILLAVTLSGRDTPTVPGISTMNGPTITTVPFRIAVDLEGETTVSTYIAQIQSQAEEMVPFEHAGLQNIRKLNERARAAIDSLAHLFVVQPSVLGGDLALEGTELVPADLAEFYTDPLVLRNHAQSDGETVDVEVKYDQSVISDSQIQRLLNQYSHVVRQLCTNDSAVFLRDIQVLSPENLLEIQRWNGDPLETMQKCVHDLVAEQTTNRPDVQAVCAWDGNYTFQELKTVSDKLATELQTLGVKPEVTVALCFDKSKWNIVAMLAVLLAGGCYTAISPAYPAARVRDMLNDVEASLVLCSPQHTDKFIDIVSLPRHRILAVDQVWLDSLPTPATPPSSSVQPSNAAFIVFTSGSTGRPKGAIVEHRGICSMQHYEGPHVDMGPDTRTLQFASHVFDVSNSEAFTTLMRGGCVCVPSEEERLNDLAGAINKYRVNWSFQVPTTADTLDPDHVPGLKILALGGEPIRQGLVDRWAGRVKLLNSYGPSECSIWTSVSQILPKSTTPNNIGRGLGCRTWITDKNDHNKLVPIGCVGELCVEGPIVTRGYRSRPEQTVAAYVENPAFAKTLLGIEESNRNMRMYKTGDLVRYEDDGTLLYVGRRDSQVKIRGQRVELSEIEHIILSSGGVSNLEADGVAVEKVVLRRDGGVDMPEQVALAAFLKLGGMSESGSDSGYASSPTSGDVSDDFFSLAMTLPEESKQREQLVLLRRRLLDTMPPHIIPTFFILLRRMPVTQTGKKDRKALRELGASLSKEQRKQYALVDTGVEGSRFGGGRACTTDAEKQLRALWAQVLGIAVEETISADDSFFLKGGDSIQAMRLASAARRVGKTLAVADMFRLPRLYQMAALLAKTTEGHQYEDSGDTFVAPFSLLQPQTIGNAVSDAARQCSVAEQDIQDIYPCTPLQEGLMAVSTQQTQAYVSTRIFSLGKHIDITRFKGAWKNAAEVFPILRTRIVLGRESESLQIVLKSDQLSWESITVTNLKSPDIKILPRIEYGGRLCAFAIDEKAHKLVWAVHHAIYDGWSATLLLSAVEKMYKGADPASLAGPAFNLFIRHLSQTINTTESANFWRSQLSDSGESSPAHFPKLSNTTHEPKASAEVSHSFQLPAQKTAGGILKTTLLKAAWALVTARHAASSDITFGVAQSGRDCPVAGIDEMVGPVITTVPVRVRINHDDTIDRFLAQIQDQSVAMIAHQHAGLQTLRRLGKDVQAALNFKSLFVFQQDDVDALYDNNSGELIAELSTPELMRGFYPYPVVIECTLGGDGLTVNMLARHDPDIVPTHQMDWLCKQFGQVVGQLASSASSSVPVPLRHVDSISPQDMATIRGWNAIPTQQEPTDNETGQTVNEAIAEQVHIRPNDLALTGWDGEMTYAELDSYTTRLAKTLVSKWGVGPEVMVPLCFDKSKWAIVASLAVIKAGGAFAHLSPTQPLERRKDILQATKSNFVLVSHQHVSLFDDATIQTVPIDQESMHLIPDDSKVHLPNPNPSNAVYVSFTSGSTGKPKGIVVEHRNLRTSARSHGSRLNIGPGTRVFQFSAYTFDIGLGDLFISLQRGATICTPSEWERLNDMPGAITKYQANWLSATPSVVAEMLSPEAVPTLRTLAIGGESPTEENIKTWSAKLDLVIWWGPTETTIYASATPPVRIDTEGGSSSISLQIQRLGSPMGCRMWLCDPSDHNKLTTLGCVGEIVVEGPLVSRGYLDEEVKTSEAFVRDVAWSTDRESRMYKTGDLARYDVDGCMLFLGRKDTQIKLHGQRIELREIEHGMLVLAGETVRQAVARVPRQGPLRGKLVAMLSFHQSGSISSAGSSGIVLLDRQDSTRRAAVVRRMLQDTLPNYMVPAVFVCVETIPLNQNAKIDRKLVDTWLDKLDQAIYQSLLQSGEDRDDKCRLPSTNAERILCQTISQLLGLEAERLNMNSSFLSLGGDSITAMKLRNQARTRGIAVTMQDIIKSKTLVELADKAKFTESPTFIPVNTLVQSKLEITGAAFSLSPIQKMFFDTVGFSSPKDMAHFDQSFFLQINRPTAPQRLREAIGAMVSRHSMLRARFARRNEEEENSDGEWYQYLADYDATASFHFTVSDLLERGQLSEMLGTGQQHAFDLSEGPLFSAHLFNIPSARQQFLFVRAHHLVVDVVSWHLLLGDLEMYLAAGHSASAPEATPALTFQTWIRLQKDMVEPLQPSEVLPEYPDIPPSDFGYWGMEGESNMYGDIIESSFSLDETATSKLLGGASKTTLNTAPLDIILSALIHSFVSTFPDHDAPTIFSEGHGREGFGTNQRIDLSNTVGWFTTISPMHVPNVHSKEISDIVRSVTETRQRIPANGMPYFGSRYMTDQGRNSFGSHSKMEILFNYLGRSQESSRKNDTLLSAAELSHAEKIIVEDQSPGLPRFALFDISAEITGNKARVTFTYHKKMQHQDKIAQWVAKAHACLELLSKSSEGISINLVDGSPGHPLSKQILELGIGMDEVHEVYPCVPMQTHMLAARQRYPDRRLYEMELSYNITAKAVVDLNKLRIAWQKVVDRHPILRTILVPITTGSESVSWSQVVLQNLSVDVPVIDCTDETDMRSHIDSHRSVQYNTLQRKPNHQLTLFVTNHHKRIDFKLEIDHALTDGVSIALMLDHLSLAYSDKLPQTPAPSFISYASWLHQHHHPLQTQTDQDSADVSYWRDFIQSVDGASPIPHLIDPEGTAVHHMIHTIPLPLSTNLPTLCAKQNVTPAAVFQTAWGLVLQRLTSSNKSLFGYMTANRDSDENGDIEGVAGPVANMLLCRTDTSDTNMDDENHVGELLRKARDDFLAGLEYQFGLAKMGPGEQTGSVSWNSVMSLQYIGERAGRGEEDCDEGKDVSFDMFAGSDPNDWDVTIGVQIGGGAVAAQLGYWSHVLSEDGARDVGVMFGEVVERLMLG